MFLLNDKLKRSQTNLASSQAENLLGDFRSLDEQIGSSDGLNLAGEVNASLRLDHVNDLAGLREFLETYREKILVPLELPSICRAYAHACRNEFSELFDVDQQLANDSRLDFFSSASKRIGRLQAKRLQPMRDQRGLQRYLRAVESGEAHAWHTIVYGITLASFSMPLRQGLLNYVKQVLDGFIRSSGNAARFGESDCNELIHGNIEAILPLIDSLLENCRFTPRIQVS